MRKLLNTLFITSENAFLSLDGETVCVEINRKKVGQFPLHTLESIVCFTYNGATPAFMGVCAKKELILHSIVLLESFCAGQSVQAREMCF